MFGWEEIVRRRTDRCGTGADEAMAGCLRLRCVFAIDASAEADIIPLNSVG